MIPISGGVPHHTDCHAFRRKRNGLAMTEKEETPPPWGLGGVAPLRVYSIPDMDIFDT
jgi:hypothetical protein